MEQLLLSISRYWTVTLDQIIHLLLGEGEEGGREGGRKGRREEEKCRFYHINEREGKRGTEL